MAEAYLDTAIEYLKGVGPRRAEVLRSELGISTFGDLLGYFPFRYADRSRFVSISELQPDMPAVQLKGRITHLESHGSPRVKRMTAVFSDGSGQLELVWFRGFSWLKKQIKADTEYIIYGKPAVFNRRLHMSHPEMEEAAVAEASSLPALYPVYNTTEKLRTAGLDSRGISRLVRVLLPGSLQYIEETLPDEMLERLSLLRRREAMQHIHFPSDEKMQQRARARLCFEELFYLQLSLIRQKLVRQEKSEGHLFERIGDYFNQFFHQVLPFSLTGAQKRVIREIRQDTLSGKQMNRLLQGDVGSGKTIVAIMAMLMALDNGFQACLMAPTEILAFQHFESFQSLLTPLGVKVGLLTGSTPAARRRELLESLKEGQLGVLIGTHALIEDAVRFDQLGMVVIDEQHRFGVAQRARLWAKSRKAPHVLVMTATPIPRTLAMTLYGDLDVSVIDELPPGRKPVKTIHRYDGSRLRVFGFLREQIQQGRQAYIVYPLIQESEALDLKDLTDGYESVVREFPLPDYAVSMVHGKMKPADKDFEMQRFARGESQILVATTVIEVGINVPNATVMIIESAERFGLSQLHQLRGRVGRGAEQSYCILMSKEGLSQDARKRLSVMTSTQDGFRIAETDLQLRGPGDLMGTRQSGLLELKMADLSRDEAVLQKARDEAIALLRTDPSLSSGNNMRVLRQMRRLFPARMFWGKIS